MVATQILNKRPEPPGPEVREQRLRPEVVAATIVLARSLPERACVAELTVMPDALQALRRT
jgi:NADP-dependent 3-hydroxy acid dehydrogenase YdfG